MTAGEAWVPPRVVDVLASVVSRGARPSWPTTLVEDCRVALRADGVGLAVVGADGPVAVLAATPGAGRTGEDLQFALGEGPCRVASASGRTVHSHDLLVDPRWTEFSREAVRCGIRAVSSAPLQVGAVRMGVLDVYRRDTGSLTLAALTSLQIYAATAVALLLLLSDGEGRDGSPESLLELVDIRPVVHQAAGMVAVQLDVTLDAALGRLRAAAFASGHALDVLAGDVVARRLEFDHTEAGMTERTRDGAGPPDDPDRHRSHADGADGATRERPDEHA